MNHSIAGEFLFSTVPLIVHQLFFRITNIVSYFLLIKIAV
jgi:hypothetical protein